MEQRHALLSANIFREWLLHREQPPIRAKIKQLLQALEEERFVGYVTPGCWDAICSFPSQHYNSETAAEEVARIKEIVEQVALKIDLQDLSDYSLRHPEAASELAHAVVMSLDIVALNPECFCQQDNSQKIKIYSIEGFLAELQYAQSIEDLEKAWRLTSGKSGAAETQFTNLGLWLQNTFDKNWQSLESPHFRKGKNDPDPPQAGVTRAKKIELGKEPNLIRAILAVTLVPKKDDRIEVKLRVDADDPNAYLPPDLELMVLDHNGEVVDKIQSGSSDNAIKLGFSGDRGDFFRVKVALGEGGSAEDFIL